MTVIGDLERSIAMAEAARGSYLLFASESEDQVAQQVFRDMAEDMRRHVKILESRREYLQQYNTLNGGEGREAKQQGNENGNRNGGDGTGGGAANGANRGKGGEGGSK